MSKFKKLYKSISEQIVLLAIIVGIFVVMSILSPHFLKISNMMNVVQYVSTYGIIAIGMTMVILTGGINLSVGGTLAISVYIAAACMLAGVPWLVSVIICLLVGAGIGAANGFAVSTLRMPPLIATLAMEQITRGLHLGLAQGAPLNGFPEEFLSIGSGSVLGIPMAVIWTIGLFIVFGLFLSKTRAGRMIYAVGGNPEATRVAGINNRKIITMVYVLAGVLCSIAGIIVVGRMDSVAVSIAKGIDMQAITACVLGGASVTIGGKGKMVGTFLGILIMGLIQNSLDLLNVSAYWQTFIQGLILFGAVSLDAVRTIQATRTKSKKSSVKSAKIIGNA